MTISILILIVLILTNAFFAASEIALVSLNDNKVKREAERGDKKAIMLDKLLKEPGRFLATIQIGITLAGFLASAFAADTFAKPLAESLYEMGVPISLGILNTMAVILITILLSYFTLVVGELVPKQLALQKAETIANIAVKPLTILFKISLPVVSFLNLSTNTLVRLFGVDPHAENEEATEEEIRMMVDIGGEKGTIHTDEKLMINNIFEFNDKEVSDIMTHRTDMCAIEINTPLSEVVKVVNEKRYTRFPVYDGNVDHIVGILHTKDLIPFIQKENKSFVLGDHLRKPYFVMETQRIDAIFKDMQKNNVHIAIIVDEYGGTDGLITIEDLIEEIVGEISSEHGEFEEEYNEIIKISPYEYRIEGNTHLYDIEYQLSLDLPVDDYETLNGFLVGKIGYIPNPEEKSTVVYKNVTFKVEEVSDKRIEKVYVTIGEK
ncbi:hemolysin family protein [Paraliobacillus salinarum]|uniref:hemolysin family protein n=1 Tax=Paraliobacillus salinarum TaxID=1158996 RepID=UPI0015F70ACD|nr:hemolysin family protein [Paraliobacillus salinarum]